MANSKIDSIKVGSTTYDITLPSDATPTIASLTTGSLTATGVSNLSSVNISGTLKATSSVNFTSSARFVGSVFMNYATVNMLHASTIYSNNITDDADIPYLTALQTNLIYGVTFSGIWGAEQDPHTPYYMAPIIINGIFGTPHYDTDVVTSSNPGDEYLGCTAYKANKVRWIANLSNVTATTFSWPFNTLIRYDHHNFLDWIETSLSEKSATTTLSEVLYNWHLCEGMVHFHLAAEYGSYGEAANWMDLYLFNKSWGSATYWNTMTTDSSKFALDVWCKFWRYGNTLRVLHTNNDGTDNLSTVNLSSSTAKIFYYTGGTSAYVAKLIPDQSYIETYLEW